MNWTGTSNFKGVGVLLLALHGRAFDREGGLVVREVGFEAGDIGRIRGDFRAGVSGEDNLVQEIRKGAETSQLFDFGPLRIKHF